MNLAEDNIYVVEIEVGNLNAARVPRTSDSDLVALGRAIRAAREAKDMTQEEVADKAKLHANYFGLVERGQSAVSVPRLQLIARALGTNASDLLKQAGL